MSRRNPSRARRRPTGGVYVNPANVLRADFAWRADGCAQSGGLTTQWNPYRGASVLAQGSAAVQAAAPAPTALLGGRLACAFTADWYTGTVALGDAQTVATVFTLPTNGLKGVWSSSNGTVNTGSSVLVSTNIQSRRIGAAGAQSTNLPANPNAAFITVAVLTLTGETFYVSALTPFTDADASLTFAQSTHGLGTLDGVGGQPFSGDIAEHAAWNRALSSAEVALLLRGWGSYYRIAIGT